VEGKKKKTKKGGKKKNVKWFTERDLDALKGKSHPEDTAIVINPWGE